jgi:hypothetical protein
MVEDEPVIKWWGQDQDKVLLLQMQFIFPSRSMIVMKVILRLQSRDRPSLNVPNEENLGKISSFPQMFCDTNLVRLRNNHEFDYWDEQGFFHYNVTYATNLESMALDWCGI